MSEGIQARKAEALAERSWDDDPAVRASVAKGDYEFTQRPNGQRLFWFRCPGQCASVVPLLIRPIVEPRGDQHSWEWDGNADAPTMKPSINHGGCWHGWLTDGKFHL